MKHCVVCLCRLDERENKEINIYVLEKLKKKISNLQQLFAQLDRPIPLRWPFWDENIISFATYGCHQSQITVMPYCKSNGNSTSIAIFTSLIYKIMLHVSLIDYDREDHESARLCSLKYR